MYTITNIVMNKLFDNHIPYLLGIIVAGPRGGKYFLDNFCIERMLESALGRYLAKSSYAELKELTNNKVPVTTLKLKYDTEKEMLDYFKKNYNCKILTRREGMDEAKKIGSKLFREY